MPICQKCKNKLEEDSKFCASCGTEVKRGITHPKLQSTMPSAKQNKALYFGIAAVGVGILLLAVLSNGLLGSKSPVASAATVKPTCIDQCSSTSNFCSGSEIYSCYDTNGDGCKEKTRTDSCTEDQTCVDGSCKRKPIEVQLYSADYDSCAVKTEYLGSSGISVIESNAIRGLDYFDKRGGIRNIGFEVVAGALKQNEEYQIEARMYDSAGVLKYSNTGVFSTNVLSSASKCNNCYIIPAWISLPYEENGRVYIKLTIAGGKTFEKTIYVNQQDCITKTIVAILNDLMECSEYNKKLGGNCECFSEPSLCISHRTASGGFYPNPNARITLIPGDRADKQKIINEINRVGFDFVFSTASNALPGFTCAGTELSATKQREVYLLGTYYSDKNFMSPAGYHYHIDCLEKDR